ncbi:deoxynucleotide monophosphate kinase family protein [Streptomyces sp. NPDC002513]
MNTPLIGFAGAAGSGKDTAASFLVERGWCRKAFADPVRDMLYAVNPALIDSESEAGKTTVAWEVDRHGWDYVKREFPEVRGYLQRLGTEAGRQVLGADVWVNALFRDCETWTEPTVISDVRFPNEADAIRKRGGLVVEIRRPSQALIEDSDHISENALADWDFDVTILNTGSLEGFRSSVEAITPT